MDQVRQLIKRRVPLTTKEVDCGAPADSARLGPLLQASPRPNALPPARWLDRASAPRSSEARRAPLSGLRTRACDSPAPPARRVRRRPSARRIRDPTTYLACYHFFEAAAHVFKNLLFPLLHFEGDRLGKPQVVLRRVNLASLQEDAPQVSDPLFELQAFSRRYASWRWTVCLHLAPQKYSSELKNILNVK